MPPGLIPPQAINSLNATKALAADGDTPLAKAHYNGLGESLMLSSASMPAFDVTNLTAMAKDRLVFLQKVADRVRNDLGEALNPDNRQPSAAVTRLVVGASTEALGNIIEPVSTASSLGDMRAACQLHKGTERDKNEARPLMLLGTSGLALSMAAYTTVGLSAVAGATGFWEAALMAKVIVGVGVLKSAATYSNEFSKFVQTLIGPRVVDVFMESASRIAEIPAVKKGVDKLIEYVGPILDRGPSIVEGLSGKHGKNTFSEISKSLRARDNVLDLYANSYDSKEVESKDSMRLYLADKNDPWNLYTLRHPDTEKNGKIVPGREFGFFTGYTVKDSEGKYHLIVEQVIPPRSVNLEANLAAWEAINAHAQALVAKDGTPIVDAEGKPQRAHRIWAERLKSDNAPNGFMDVEIPYEQPPLLGQTATSNNLRMTVNTMGNSDISANEVKDVVIDRWLRTWYEGIEKNNEYVRIRDGIINSLPASGPVQLTEGIANEPAKAPQPDPVKNAA